jgi:hypothetical protein
MVNLLLVDTSVRGYEKIIAAANADTKCIPYDRAVDTFLSLLKKIGSLSLISITNVGIVQHGTDSDTDYRMLDTEPAGTVVDVENVDPTLTSWSKFTTFITYLKNKYAIQNVDFISCLLYNNPNWVYIIKTLEAKILVNFRASKDTTGNLAQGANWTMESDNVNIEPIYFTNVIKNFKGLLYYTNINIHSNRMITKSFTRRSPLVNGTTVKSNNMYTFSKPQILIDSWGSLGTTIINPPKGTTNIRAIAASTRSYIGITTSDTLISWGDVNSASLPNGIENVDVITANDFTFCALKKDGSLSAWGYNAALDPYSGTIPSNISSASDYIAVVANGKSFAALKSNRTVVAWGDSNLGGFTPTGLTNVASIEPYNSGFIALKQDGTVAIWTNPTNGVQTISGLTDIVSIYGSYSFDFIAVNSSGIAYHYDGTSLINKNNTSPVVAAYPPSTGGFICLCDDNTIFSANFPFSNISDYTNIKGISGAGDNIALLKLDGSVVYDSYFDTTFPAQGITNVSSIAGNLFALTAIKTDKTIISWGTTSSGGITPTSSTNVSSIIGLTNAFVALREDKTLVGWGNSTSGATIPADVSNIDNIIPASRAVAAFRDMSSSATISTHPASQTIAEGSSVSFTVDVSGATSPTYQWKKDGTNISGATSAIYTIASVQQSDAGSYTVVVVDGATTLTSNAATLTVSAGSPPSIISQPTSLIVLDGSSATFSVAATGTGLSYQWRRNGVDISGATSALYTIEVVSAGNVGSYSVVVSNSAGSTTSSAVTLSIGTAPVITQQPTSIVATAGAAASFAVGATGTNLTYQWRKGGIAILGAVSSAYTILAAQVANVGAYSVVISNAFGSVESNIVSLSISIPPQITAQPVEFPEVSGGNVSISVDISGTEPFSYQWLRDNRPIAGATSATYMITGANSTHAGAYRVRVSNSAGFVVSQEAVLTAPRIQQQPSGTVVDNSTTLSVSASGNSTLTYQWRKDGVAIVGATNTSYTISDVAANGGVYTVVVSNAFGSRTSVQVALASAPVIVRQPEARTVLAGSSVRFGILATGQGLSYQWKKDGENISDATSASYDITSVASENAGAYSVSITNTVGTTTSTAVQLSVITVAEPSKEVLKDVVKTGAAPINQQITFNETIDSVVKEFVSQTKQPDPIARTVEVIPTSAPQAPRTTIANIPAEVAKVSVSAIPAPIIDNDSGEIRTIIDFKFFDENNNKLSDFADNPVLISVELPAIFTASVLNVYRVDDVTGAEIFAGTALLNTETGRYDVTLDHFTRYIFGNTTVPCFVMGTRVLTAGGFKKIEELTREDRIMTSDGRAVPFARAHRIVPHSTYDDAPYRIPADTFGPQMPPADVVLSPSHAFQSAPGVWQFPELAAKKYPAIRQVSIGERVVYFHIKLPNYLTDNIVLEGGVIAESFGGEELSAMKGIFRYDRAVDGYRRKEAPKQVARR